MKIVVCIVAYALVIASITYHHWWTSVDINVVKSKQCFKNIYKGLLFKIPSKIHTHKFEIMT